MIRDSLKAAQVAALKSGDKPRLAALRLILARLKDRDIELRTQAAAPEDDALVIDVLRKLAKQRRESIAMYTQGNRPELAAAEAAELGVIEEFLPTMLSEEATKAAIAEAITATGAASAKDMGKVIAALKARHGDKLDMARASALVKAALTPAPSSTPAPLGQG